MSVSVGGFRGSTVREMGDAREFNRQPSGGATVDLAYRDLTEVTNYLADQHGHTVEFLDLSHNRIRNLQCLARFDRLRTLILDHNDLSSSSIPPPLPHLTTLWLNHNNIADVLPFLRALRYNCPSLEHLSLLGNPAVPSMTTGDSRGHLYRYRIDVLSRFPSLVTLDQLPVEDWERPESDTIWSRVGSTDHWRDLQRKMSVGASELVDNVSESVTSGLDRLATWWENRSEYQPPPSNTLV